jgi:hypothetical protein
MERTQQILEVKRNAEGSKQFSKIMTVLFHDASE